MPQVESPPPREPRRSKPDHAGDTLKRARRMQPRRPFTFAPDGHPAPTDLEIEEGRAHKALWENLKSRILQEEWHELHWRLYNEQGPPPTSRCADCHTVLFGRTREMGCGVCGCHEVFRDEIRRPDEG